MSQNVIEERVLPERHAEMLERDERERLLFHQLESEPSQYENVSLKKRVRVLGFEFSLRWILYYAQCRNRGIACMYYSTLNANQRTYGVEFHHYTQFTRRMDVKLLAIAAKYRCNQRRKGVTMPI